MSDPHDLSPPPAPPLVSQGLSLLLAGLLGRIGIYLFQLELAWWLPPAELSAYFLAFTLLQGAVLLCLLGLDAALVKLLPRVLVGPGCPVGATRLERQTTFLGVGAALTLGMAVALGSDPLAEGFPQTALEPLLWVIGFPLLALVLHRLKSAQLQAREDFAGWIALRHVAYPLLLILASPGLLWLWPDARAALLAQTLAVGGALVIVSRGARTHRTAPPSSSPDSEPSLRLALRFGFPILLTGLLGFSGLWLDLLLVGHLLPPGDVARYGVVVRLGMLVMVVLEAFNGVLSPLTARLDRPGPRAPTLVGAYQDATRIGMLLTLPIFVTFLMVPELPLSLFGRTYVSPETRLALRLLSLGQLVNVGVGGAGALLVMGGRPGIQLLNSILMLLVSSVLCLWWIPMLGLVGAAGAAALAIALVNGLRLLELLALWKLHPFTRGWARGILAALLAGGSLELGLRALAWLRGVRWLQELPGGGQWLLGETSLLSWLSWLLAMGVYAVFLVRLGLEPAERALLLEIRQRLRGERTVRADRADP